MHCETDLSMRLVCNFLIYTLNELSYQSSSNYRLLIFENTFKLQGASKREFSNISRSVSPFKTTLIFIRLLLPIIYRVFFFMISLIYLSTVDICFKVVAVVVVVVVAVVVVVLVVVVFSTDSIVQK